MKKSLIISLLALICFDALSCSGFVFKNNGKLYLCANLDMQAMQGYIIINKRNIEKFSFFAIPPNILKWTSKYGSVTFSSIGKEFPFGGMNEKGLTVAVMTTRPVVYPKSDNRYEINESQWVQYILDNYSSTTEVINSDSLLRINRFFDNWHYLICDKKGDIAIIEYKDGLRKVFSGSNITVPVLENSFYEVSLTDWKGDKSRNSLMTRFSKATYLLENIDYSKINIDDPKSMFPILDNLKQGITRWQIVYDIENGNLYYRANTYSYLLKPGSKGFIMGGPLGDKIDLNSTDFTGETLARKLGIVYVEKNSSSTTGPPYKISYPDKNFMPFSKVFDSDLLNFNIDIFKSQGAKNITKQIVERYILFAKKEDYSSLEMTKH
jgi:hypothetical protein